MPLRAAILRECDAGNGAAELHDSLRTVAAQVAMQLAR
jgi:hypothetical protein